MCVMFGGTMCNSGVQCVIRGYNVYSGVQCVIWECASHGERSELKTLEIPSSWWPAPDQLGGPDPAAKVINNLKIYV